MALIFIDKFGTQWDSGSLSFAQHYVMTNGLDRTTVRFLVRQAGLAAVAIDDVSAHVDFIPALTSPSACLAIMKLLDKHKPDRVALSWFGPDWTHELSGGVKSAQRRISELSISKRGDPNPKFITITEDVEGLASDNPLAQIFEIWRTQGQSFDILRDAEKISESVGGRFFVVGRDGDATDSGVSVAEAGPGWHALGSDWGKRMIGRDVAHQADLSYGKWCADCFRNALEVGRPQISINDVLVRVPHNSNAKRLCYQRMTLPIRTSAGKPALLSTTFVDPSIDLRAEI